MIAVTAGAALISCHPAKRTPVRPSRNAPQHTGHDERCPGGSGDRGHRARSTSRCMAAHGHPQYGEHTARDGRERQPLASEAGLEILRAAGTRWTRRSRRDFALAVDVPEAGNLGGGGYMVIRLADGRSPRWIIARSRPLASTRDMFLDAKGQADGQEPGRARSRPGFRAPSPA